MHREKDFAQVRDPKLIQLINFRWWSPSQLTPTVHTHKSFTYMYEQIWTLRNTFHVSAIWVSLFTLIAIWVNLFSTLTILRLSAPHPRQFSCWGLGNYYIFLIIGDHDLQVLISKLNLIVGDGDHIGVCILQHCF